MSMQGENNHPLYKAIKIKVACCKFNFNLLRYLIVDDFQIQRFAICYKKLLTFPAISGTQYFKSTM